MKIATIAKSCGETKRNDYTAKMMKKKKKKKAKRKKISRQALRRSNNRAPTATEKERERVNGIEVSCSDYNNSHKIDNTTKYNKDRNNVGFIWGSETLCYPHQH